MPIKIIELSELTAADAGIVHCYRVEELWNPGDESKVAQCDGCGTDIWIHRSSSRKIQWLCTNCVELTYMAEKEEPTICMSRKKYQDYCDYILARTLRFAPPSDPLYEMTIRILNHSWVS